jgi:hypothetical protein
VPLVWYPRLFSATPAQRANWRLAGGGFGIHWPDVDEDLTTEGLLRGALASRGSRISWADNRLTKACAATHADPDNFDGEARYLLLGMSAYQRLLVVAFVDRPPRTRLLSPGGRPEESGGDMKRKARGTAAAGRDTLRAEYDFSQAVRGATASRYARGANIVVVDPKVLDVFPDGASVNEALRALAPVIRRRRRGVRRRRSA